ncbi:sn-glycerol-3-phosphate ABC transporter ATP-binding protein UgpC [Olsenella sp. kh2p3]|jgi:multiple sugar transport system ATP-binding protein|uniref:ABC transporter ATP-binding protein n=1 Tax=Olsenella sp. kh2p3 TaxID=1797112 RepID=UPI00091357B0|nr:sn-glycerol-3-phosphate ABC transporter ATP-binding protein UgpC [Olsenella sp. kh2p3]MCI2085941.1 sn-glycerol-3-phosphate ABC transporter ATP-binding protein UgpC [Olsenella sp.]SFX07516.1 carbohydrate ABC transporter ATP-binding protein, CUT1 family [Olsenella sp. kh2p3]
MAEVSLKHITKIYPNIEKTKKHRLGKKAAEPEKKKSNLKVTDEGVVAVEDFNLDIADREFVVLVGPSGCGKSTTLRMIAGLESISGGELAIDGKVMNEVAPKDRDIAMVFQSYALYPHMTVYDNMAFPLKLRKVPEDQIDQKVRQAAETLGITQYLDRKPKALSGGQRQRVAIGRAIVRDPKVLLMDEPLSNLDAKLRNQMRAEIIKLRKRINATFVYVTHDQTEAMTLGDRIVIMKDGVVQQVGTPQEVFNEPANLFVAGFIGVPQMNFFDGHLEKTASGYVLNALDSKIAISPETGKDLEAAGVTSLDVTAGVRPEQIQLANADEPGAISGTIDVSELMGSTVHVHASVEGYDFVLVIPTIDFDGALGRSFADGAPISFKFEPNAVHFFDKASGKNIIKP